MKGEKKKYKLAIIEITNVYYIWNASPSWEYGKIFQILLQLACHVINIGQWAQIFTRSFTDLGFGVN